MKVYKLLIAALLLATLTTASVFAEYDRNAVVKVMRGNLVFMREIKTAADNQDYYLTAQKLMELANGMITIIKFTPRRGEKTAWDETLDEFVKTAFKGIGACGEEDKQTLDEAITRLQQLNSLGHQQFK